MATTLLRVFQIYYHESQRGQLETEYLPFFNYHPTEFFESQIIRDLVDLGQHKDAEYFGVVSYKLRYKVGTDMKQNWRGHPNIANHSENEFSPEAFAAQLREHRPDAMSFQCHMPHDPISTAESFHPGFMNLWSEIMRQIGWDWTPTRIDDIFYCNFFVARREIYDDYVNRMLAPAMDVMSKMNKLGLLLWQDSNYRNSPVPEFIKARGIDHWPFHPFICERFFSWYAHKMKLKCLHY